MLNTTVAAIAAADIFTRLFDDMSSYSEGFTGEISLGLALLCLCGALVLGFLTSCLYMFTNRKKGYAQSYVIAMPIVAMMTAAIILTMCKLIDSSNSAFSSGARLMFTLTAAFSLTRFRSVPMDPKDLAYILSAVVMGVMCGTGYVGYAALLFVILAVAMLILNLTGFAAPKTQNMTLKITIPENLNYNGLFDDVMEKYTTNWKLRRVKTTDFGTLFDLMYDVQVKENIDQKKFIDEIRTLNGNLNVTLVLYRYDDQIYDPKAK